MKQLLRDIAKELGHRGDRGLARRCLAAAQGLPEIDDSPEGLAADLWEEEFPDDDADAGVTDYPEADALPPNPEGTAWDEDWELKTGDYGGNLRVPPYDKPRPRTQGDDGEE